MIMERDFVFLRKRGDWKINTKFTTNFLKLNYLLYLCEIFRKYMGDVI